MVGRTVEQFGRLDFVVMNAGFAIRFEESLLKIPLEKLAENMRTLFEVFPITLAMLALAAARVIAPFEPEGGSKTDPFITFHEIPFARPNAHPRRLIRCGSSYRHGTASFRPDRATGAVNSDRLDVC